MSNYYTEYRRYKQACYGGYCNLCRELGVETKSYDKFEIEDVKQLKKLKKEKVNS